MAIMWHIYANINFNSRTHVECDKRRCGAMCRQDHFNSRTHVECDCECIQFQFWNNSFQLTHSRGVRLCIFSVDDRLFQFQLTHSRGVRQDRLNDHSRRLDISTHALTWSATCSQRRGRILCRFQLTHSRGVRPLIQQMHIFVQDFNSRTHVECDFQKHSHQIFVNHFNSRTHVECD